MYAVDLLTAIQQQTNTKAIPWSSDMDSCFFDDTKKKIGNCDDEIIRNSINATVQELYSCQLPTKYESSLHYPTLHRLLTELYEVRDKVFLTGNVIDTDIPMPLIGSANFQTINAYSNPQHKLIVIDRSLCYFLTGIVELIVDIVTTNQDGSFVIRPSKLDYQSVKQKIASNHELCCRFTEIMASYVIFRGVWSYERYNYGNEDKFLWHEVIGLEVWRFVVSHEFAHILLKHSESTQVNEYQADWLGAYLCTVVVHLNEHLRKQHIYWAMAIAAEILDMLRDCCELFHHLDNTHPPYRIATILDVLKKAKADEYTIGMVYIVHSIFEILWEIVKTEIEEIAELCNDGILSTVEDVKTYISTISWDWYT